MGGGVGNSIFVMLSGYFLVKSQHISIRRLFNLWIRLFFYSVAIYAVFLLSGMEAFDPNIALKALMPVIYSQLWFAKVYFVLYLIHPYINTLLRHFSQNSYRKFLVAVMLYLLIFQILTYSYLKGNSLSNLINFICLYSIAGYVRLWADDYGSKKFIYYGIAFFVLHFMAVIVLEVIGMKFSESGGPETIIRPFMIMAALCMLIGFKHLTISYSKIINTIASAAFGVYLIHDNGLVRPFLWHDVFHNASFQDSVYLIPYSIAVILIVYVACTLIELIRSKVFRILSGERLS